jgi:4-hydroxythreonine-4-phosphate dehydrogenase
MDPGVFSCIAPVFVGPADVFRAVAESLSAPFRIVEQSGEPERSDEIPCVLPENCSVPETKPGQTTPEAGALAVKCIVHAAETVMRGDADALVTAPINKAAIHMAGYEYAGHTELLAELTRTEDYRMMLVAGSAHVVHVTTHLSLRDALGAIAERRIAKTIELTDTGLKRLGIASPRIVVAALNPHAGEGGIFGNEEEKEIAPAVEKSVSQGINASGPFPADTVFQRLFAGDFDAAIAMYHDQGHIAVKSASFESAVNMTLGLPIVRTSPAHGTAYDIAGRNIANPSSMIAAVKLAARAASNG